jgi:hypothetical protein
MLAAVPVSIKASGTGLLHGGTMQSFWLKFYFGLRIDREISVKKYGERE